MLTEVSATQFEQHAAAMLAQVQQHHRPVLIKRDGKPVAALVDSQLLDRLLHVQASSAGERGDLSLAAQASDHAGQGSRQEAVAVIQALRKSRQAPAASIDEIIAWRDEGRK